MQTLFARNDSKLKDQEKARMMFERVVDQYPDSPEAEVARKALEIEAEKPEAEKPEPTPISTE